MSTTGLTPKWECIKDSGDNMNRRFLLIRVEVEGFGFTYKVSHDLFLPEHEAGLKKWMNEKYRESLGLLGYIAGEDHVLH